MQKEDNIGSHWRKVKNNMSEVSKETSLEGKWKSTPNLIPKPLFPP